MKNKYYWAIILLLSAEVGYLSISQRHLLRRVVLLNDISSRASTEQQDALPNYLLQGGQNSSSYQLLRNGDKREILLFVNLSQTDLSRQLMGVSNNFSNLSSVYRIVFLFTDNIVAGFEDSLSIDKTYYELAALNTNPLYTIPKNGIYHLSFEGKVLGFFTFSNDAWHALLPQI